jgi:hypothetical protein
MFDETRYPAIRGLIILLRAIASIPTFIGIYALLSGGVEQFRPKPGIALWLVLLLSVGPLVLGMLIFAASEILRLLVAIEGNTRRTSDEVALLPLALRPDQVVHKG